MDQRKLVAIIKSYPPIWDRDHPFFRERALKEKSWEDVSNEIGFSKDACKDAFKAIREKYLRERDKLSGFKEWDLLDNLKFLDPHILPRKLHPSICDQEDTVDSFYSQPEMSSLNQHIHINNPCAFDLALISAVKQNVPIWDRNCSSYPNRPAKSQLWITIAKSLNRDMNTCMLRWKALREKYIRQKTKFLDGEMKWDLLDHLSFLDKVIHYRKKTSESNYYRNETYSQAGKSNSQYQTRYSHQSDNCSPTEGEYNHIQVETNDDHSYTDSSNDFLSIVKQEGGTVQQIADSSFQADTYSRKRSASVNSDVSFVDKRSRNEENNCYRSCNVKVNSGEENQKSPEQLFGDLVAVLLGRKPEKDRNRYMIDIMTVLSKE